MLDLNAFIFIAIGAAFLIVGVLAWLVDSGLSDKSKVYVKYSLFGLFAGVMGLFYLIKDDSEFEYGGWTPTEEAGKKDTSRGGGMDVGNSGGGGKATMKGGGGGSGELVAEEDDAAPPPMALQDGEVEEEKKEEEDEDKLATKQDCAQCPEVVIIKAGQAFIGASKPIKVKGASTAKAQKVHVKRDFGIGKYEVTLSQFRVFLAETGYTPKGRCKIKHPKKKVGDFSEPGFKQSDTSPVVCITYEDALAYTNYLTELTGVRYRLPTEIEWEYAARAGLTGGYATAERITSREANFADQHGGHAMRTMPVGSYPENENGLFDMQGNVWEMTSDCWSNGYLGGGKSGGVDCKKRVAKGGAWFSRAEHLHFSIRVGVGTRLANTGLGFRVVREDMDPVRRQARLSNALSGKP